MSDSIYSGPNPTAQNTVKVPDLGEPEPLSGDQIPPDPLLESGWFIDANQKADAETATQTNREPEQEMPATAETTTTIAPETAVPLEVTPISQRRPGRPVEELEERPNWLPEDWKIEVRVRTSGATAGHADRYFISPSGQRFRSKVEVLRFLETGSKRKKNLKSDADATPSESPSNNKKKKSKPNIRNFSDLKFDFKNPPQGLTWVQEDDCPDAWVPIADNIIIPESKKIEWGSVFSRVTQLDRSNGAS
ncbi:hypothetical protein ACH5RR_009670 [Cinchona calisaya]|uniref:MBD domain-containing protein n=1 Tax=Cinchona calisaya TaxID=153742 RepID=A0ABD3AGT5_9GENT